MLNKKSFPAPISVCHNCNREGPYWADVVADNLLSADWDKSPTEWLVAWLQRKNYLTDRKARLYGCHVTRFKMRGLGLKRNVVMEDVDIAERFADGDATDDELTIARVSSSLWCCMENIQDNVETIARIYRIYKPAKDRPVLHDLFDRGNPQTKVSSGVRQHADWTPYKLALSIYQDKRFHLMPILADALEDAGCDDKNILEHCRRENDKHEAVEHWRGCWALDAVLWRD